jgi:hypothetical protein
MSGFVRLDGPDPYELFGAQFRRSRFALQTAYDEAFAAWDRRSELLKEHEWSSGYGGMEIPWLSATGTGTRELPQATLDRMWDEALAENVQADSQASIVLLVADDALQRLARGVLGDEKRAEGYGLAYGAPYKGLVKFTRLLRAGTNAIRHVSEWDDLPWRDFYPWPVGGNVYPPLDDCKQFEREARAARDECVDRQEWQVADARLRATVGMRRAMESIDIFQRVFGIGVNALIRDPVSFHIITAVDGRLGHGTSYARFEAAILIAAREIAAQMGSEAEAKLEEQLAEPDPDD